MIGGKLVAEGGYGCIFNPGINCDGSIMKTKKYASKIQRYDSSARNEITIGREIQELNSFDDHFAPILKFCEIDIASIKDDSVKKCTVLKKKKTNKFIVMKMQYIEGSDFLDYLISQKNSAQLVSNIILSFNHLLKSLTRLIEKKIVHYDLKGTNILFDNNKQIPLLIDFGLSFKIKNVTKMNLKQFFYIYAPEYYIWPLEVHYLCFLANHSKEPTMMELKEMAKRYVENNKALNRNFSPGFLKKFENKCLRQLEKYNSLPFDERVMKILSYWETFDNYSLAIMYLKFLYYINIGGFIENNFIIFFSKLLLRNIDPCPEDRLKITETIHTFNIFLYQKNINNIKTFEELTDTFIENRINMEDEITKDRKHHLVETKTMRIKKRNQSSN